MVEARVQHLYRYEARRYSVVVDADLEIFGTTPPRLELLEYRVHSETPCGYWFGFWGGKDYWCSKTSRKRRAHPTREEALKAYVERKKAFLRHSEKRVKRASEELVLGELELGRALERDSLVSGE